MTPRILKTMFCFLFVTAAMPSYALESDRSKPIEIEADQGSLDQTNQVTVFSGNVVVKQGSLNISAANVKLTRDNQGQQIMVANGNPVRFRQSLDNNKGVVDGQANRVEYSSASNVVTLTENAKVQRGSDCAEGASIIYNTRTEVYTVKGRKGREGNAGKRVTVVIQPQNK